MTNWTSLVAKLDKAEADAKTWRDGLADAEVTLTAAKGELAAALGTGKGKRWPIVKKNGSEHKPTPAGVPEVVSVAPMHVGRCARVLELVAKKGGFVTPRDVQVDQKIKRQYAHALLSQMQREGRIRRVSTGRYSSLEDKS